MAEMPERGGLSAHFPDAQKPRRMLYHAMPTAPEGDVIRSSTNYGTTIPDEIKERLGVADQDHAPLVFASPTLSKALAFGLNGRWQEKILNAEVPEAGTEIVLVCDRDVVMARPRAGAVFAFPDDGFADLPQKISQSVSTQPVPFSATQKVLDVRSADDLMRAGLQIFSFKEKLRDLPPTDEIMAPMISQGLSWPQFLAQKVRDGSVVWENHARGINPNPVLAESMGLKLPRQVAPTP